MIKTDNYKMPSFRKNNYDKFAQLDLFGQPVQLTFKGDNKFRTPFGAFLTITMVILLTSYILFEALDMVDGQIKLLTSEKIPFEIDDHK